MAGRIREVMMKKVWRIPAFLLLTIIVGVSIVAAVVTYTLKPTAQDLRFEVWTDKKAYGVNETIIIHLKIINPTYSQVCLHFSSGHQFDYIIFDQTGNQLYKWSHNKAFTEAFTKICVNSHSSYERTFNHTSEDYSLQHGMYTIKGLVVGYFLKDTTIEVLEN